MAKSGNSNSQVFGGFHVNPFINKNFTILVNLITDDRTHILNNKTNKFEVKQFKYERDKITKILRSATKRDKIALLRPNAQRMWLWIQQEVQTEQTKFKLNRITYETSNKKRCSKNTINEALKDLQLAGLIAQSDIKDVYFVNPEYLFTGSRIKEYPDHVEVYKPENPRK
jgi:hypothetical protein